ncbi:Pvc16 family protein [Streptomyces sp. SS8]
MSNALAIATVTQALALLIEHNLRPEIDMQVAVKTERPPAEATDDATITVFLYQVTPNTSRRNDDLPTRAPDGTLLRRPAAALDLHYLISAYGNEAELVGQRLIGCVVRTLHEFPVLPGHLIEEAAQRPYLAGGDLTEAVQRVRFTPAQMDIDETSKLWGMLHQTPYSLSVAYQAALVLIEGRGQPVVPRPVQRHMVRALPFGAPGAPGAPRRPGTGTADPAAVPAERASGTAARKVAARASRAGGMAARSAAPTSRAETESGPETAEPDRGTSPRKTPAEKTAGKRRAAARTAAPRTRTRKQSGTGPTRGGGSTPAGGDDGTTNDQEG